MKRKTGYRSPNGRLRQPTKPRAPGVCVYVIEVEGSGAVKIGISVDPADRCRDFQIGNHSNATVFYAIRIAIRSEAASVEKKVHNRLKAQDMHMRGEWFRCSTAYARAEILNAAEALGVKYADDERFGWGKRSVDECDPRMSPVMGAAMPTKPGIASFRQIKGHGYV